MPGFCRLGGIAIFWLGFAAGVAAQSPAGDLIRIQCQGRFETSGHSFAMAVVYINDAPFLRVPTGTEFSRKAMVAELPVRIAVYAEVSGQAPRLLRILWADQSTFTLSGTLDAKGKVILEPASIHQPLEDELARLNEEDRLKLIASHSHTDVGLYYLWHHRAEFKPATLRAAWRRVPAFSRSYSYYRMLTAYLDAFGPGKTSLRRPIQGFSLPQAQGDTLHFDRHQKGYTLLLLAPPACPDCASPWPELKRLLEKYGSGLQVITITYEPNQFLWERQWGQLAASTSWPVVNDPQYLTLLHYRVRLDLPLGNGIHYGTGPSPKPASLPTRILLPATGNRPTGGMSGWPDGRVGNFAAASGHTATKIAANQPTFLLVGPNQILLARWEGYAPGVPAKKLQKHLARPATTKTRTAPW